MYLVSTSSNWNVGDDIIREGVFRILDIGSRESIIWLNRCQVIYPKNKFGWTALWKVLRNQPELASIIPYTDAFILAGTPEWLHTLEDVYDLCLKHRIPIWAIGVGMPQPGYQRLKKCRNRNLISYASVRDDLATETLNKAGISHRWFLDPAFHAKYEPTPEKSLDVVLTYKRNADNGIADTVYLELYRKFHDRIDMIAVHHPDEYVPAQQLFGTDIYYSSNYTDFKRLYACCKHLITNRIHSAAPALRNGAEVHFFTNIQKHRMVELWAKAFERVCSPSKSPLHIYPFSEWHTLTLSDSYPGDDLDRYFAADFQAHQEYARLITQ